MAQSERIYTLHVTSCRLYDKSSNLSDIVGGIVYTKINSSSLNPYIYTLHLFLSRVVVLLHKFPTCRY